MLYKQPINEQWVDMMPEDVRALRATVERVRGASAPFEIVVGGRERRDDWGAERVHIHALAEAGATWWSEWVPAAPLHVMCEAIANGPLRVD